MDNTNILFSNITVSMNQKTVAILIVAVVLVAGIGGAVFVMNNNNGGSDDGDTPGTDIMKDAVGRDIEVPDNLDKGIVIFGSLGVLRYVSVFDVMEHITEVDKSDTETDKFGRGYSYSYDCTGLKYHEDNVLTDKVADRIGNEPPSLVIMSEKVYRGNNLAQTLDSAVDMLVIKNQTWTDFFDEDFQVSDLYRDNINMIGKALKMEDRAAEHLAGLQAIFDDIRGLVAKDTFQQKSFYVAGLTKGGSHDWATTFPSYLPQILAGGVNAYDGDSTAAFISMDPEVARQYIEKCDYIIIDPSSADRSVNDPNTKRVIDAILDINEQRTDNDIRLFVTYPIVWDHMNYDCVLASAYFLVPLQDPTFTIDMVEERIAHVFDVYYGERGADIPADMKAFFEGFASENGVELPILSEVEVGKDGGYTIKAVTA